MASGRVDGGGGRDAAASVARAAQSVLDEIGTADTIIAPPEAGTFLGLDESFDPSAKRERAAKPRSPQQLIADFVEPSIADMTPFISGGALAILEHIAAEIIPTLGDNEELRTLARAVINDEIARHRELEKRRLSEIPL
jgi:hypothetical protein